MIFIIKWMGHLFMVSFILYICVFKHHLMLIFQSFNWIPRTIFHMLEHQSLLQWFIWLCEVNVPNIWCHNSHVWGGMVKKDTPPCSHSSMILCIIRTKRTKVFFMSNIWTWILIGSFDIIHKNLIVICSDNVTNVNYPFFTFNKQQKQ